MKKYQCIYTGETRPECFKEREHIIPRAIGGIYTLPVGYVSDAVNARFSKLEGEFVHKNPLVAVNRQLTGPAGRKKHTRPADVSFVETQSEGEAVLGYLQQAQPYIISQMIFALTPSGSIQNKGKLQAHLTAEYRGLSSSQSLDRFYHEITHAYQKSQRFTIIHTDNEKVKNKLYVGCAGNHLYLGVYKECNIEQAVQLGHRAIKIITTMLPQKHKVSAENPKYKTDLVTISSSYEFDVILNYRVYGKIAFNVLAALTNQDFMQNPALDPLRNAILSGYDIEKMVCLASNTKRQRTPYSTLFRFLHLGNQAHVVSIFNKGNDLYSIVCLYGDISPIQVYMGKSSLSDFGLYICDWQNHREGELMQFLKWAHQQEFR